MPPYIPDDITELLELAENDPQAFAEFVMAIDESRHEQDREVYEGSLIKFFARAWREIDPNPLKINWHHMMIADHLEAVMRGEIRKLLINIPPRPVSVDALVDTARGLIPLGEIRVGDAVLTHRRRWRAVTAVHEQGDLPVLSLTTRAGLTLDLAPDHPVLTPGGWVNAAELRQDDVIGIVPGMPSGADEVSIEEARLLGYLIGDGRCSGTPNVTCKDDGVAVDVMRCAEALGFAGTMQTYALKTRRVSIRSGATEHRRIALSGAPENGRTKKGYLGPVRRWLVGHGLDGKNSYTKRIPAAVMRGSDAVVAAYLGAYWSCDGFFVTRGIKRDGTQRDDLQIGCDSVSRELMLDTQQLLRRLGINSLVRRKHNAKLITKRQGVGYTSWFVSLRSQDDCWRFAQAMTLAHAKDEIIRLAKKRRFDFDRDIWGEVVASNEPNGNKRCRCLTVAEDASFLANGVAVHNCTKTLLTNVIYPAWVWAQSELGPRSGPQVSFMCISYGSTLSMEIARTARRLVQSNWYQRHWGSRVKIWSDQSGIENFGTTAGGFRLATSMSGATLGRGASIRILDDPHKISEAESETERESVIRTYDEALSTRETDPANSAEIIVMQRIHELDLSGHILNTSGADLVHLMLPMRHDPTRHCSTPWGEDPRVDEGELLWPAQFSEIIVRAREARLGPFSTAGQYQQIPSPRGGGIIERDWWQAWPDHEIDVDQLMRSPDGRTVSVALPEVTYVLVVLDTAISEKESASYNACTVWGIWTGPEPHNQPRAILMEAWRRRCRLHDATLGPDGMPMGLVERTLETARRRRADAVLIEDKTRGRDVRDELIRLMGGASEFMLHLFDPKKHGDKTNRLLATQPLFTAKQVYAPIAFDPKTGQVVEYRWVETVVAETASFPRGQFTDFVDTVSMGLLWLRGSNLLPLAHEHLQQQMEAKMFRGRRSESAREHYGV